MNLIDRIFLDPITKSVRMLTKGGVGFVPGEVITVVQSASTNIFNTTQNICSAIIPAGTWDISGHVIVDYVIGSSSRFVLALAIDTTSAALNDPNVTQTIVNFDTNLGQRSGPTRTMRYSFPTPTTVYLVGATQTISGGLSAATSRSNSATIEARRV